jgi:hypothetical protein
MARAFALQLVKIGICAHPVAAGFVSSMKIGSPCHGESETLNLKSRGAQDDRLIAVMDYSHGIVPAVVETA